MRAWHLAAAVAGSVLLAVCPFLTTNPFQIYMMNVLFINVILAVGLDIVKGLAGQVTVGQMGLCAVGAYTSALLAVHLGWSFWLCLPAAVLAAGLAGVLVGVPSLRLSGAYLGLATLGFAESVRIFLSVTNEVGGSSGLGSIPAPRLGNFSFEDTARYYYLVMPLALLGVYIALSLSRSGIGRAFKAIREDPLAAAAAGVSVRRYKLLAFVIGAMYAGCAGSLLAHQRPGYIAPEQFTLMPMIAVLLMVILGGIGRIWGAVIGAVLVTTIDVFARSYYYYEHLIFGMIIVLVVNYMPNGIAGLIESRRAQRRFIERKAGRADVA